MTGIGTTRDTVMDCSGTDIKHDDTDFPVRLPSLNSKPECVFRV